MFEHARAAFAAAGLAPYEISSYARARAPLAPQPPLLVARARTWASARRRRRSGRSPTAAPGGSRTRARPTSTCADRDAPRTSSGGRRPISRTRRSGSGLRTADGIDRAAHRARHGVDPARRPRRRGRAAPSLPAGSSSTRPRPAHPSRRPVRRRGRDASVEVGAVVAMQRATAWHGPSSSTLTAPVGQSTHVAVALQVDVEQPAEQQPQHRLVRHDQDVPRVVAGAQIVDGGDARAPTPRTAIRPPARRSSDPGASGRSGPDRAPPPLSSSGPASRRRTSRRAARRARIGSRDARRQRRRRWRSSAAACW